MLISLVRTLILYALVVVSIRIMGKRQIGELQPSELVVAIMISDLATIPMSDSAIPLLYGIVPILTLVLCEIFLSYLCLKSQTIRAYVTGRPAYIINKGIINQEEMTKARYSLSDLLEELRMMNVFDISQVECALLETNGKISVITSDNSGRGYVLVCDGVIQEVTLHNSPYNKKDLYSFIGKTELKNIFLLSVNDRKEVYLSVKSSVKK